MEEISSAEDVVIEETQSSYDPDEASFEIDDDTDEYMLNITVAVTEVEGEEIEHEFDDALMEIEGKKSFPCSQCEKVCKSQSGLTRHTNSKHKVASEKNQNLVPESFCMDTVANMIETIKGKIIKEKLYGAEINERVKKVTCTKDLYEAIYPIMQTFWRKNNQDQLFESLFGLIPKSCVLLKFNDYQAVNLVMIHLPDYLVAFYHKSRGQNVMLEGETTSQIQQTKLDPAERGPLTYVSGYVVAKLFQKSKRAKNPNLELHSLLQNMRSLDESSYISARTRGGLVHPSKDLVGILEECEHLFRKEMSTNKSSCTRNIPTDLISNAALESPLVKSLWDNIVFSSGVDPSGDTQKLCLENTIKLYLKVRSFSFARDYLNRHKIKEKQTKKRALRTDLKTIL